MTTIAVFPSPLPRKPAPSEEWRIYRPNYLSAYNIILNAEYHAAQQVGTDSSDQEASDNVMFARVAGYLLLELFNRRVILTETPCISLVKQILSPSREFGTARDVVFAIGSRGRENLLRLFRTSAKKYPTPSLHPSRPSFDILENMINDDMMADGKDYRTARRKVLARDGYRCVVTGMFDRTSLRRNHELKQLCDRLGTASTTVQACHILNESTMQGIDPTGTSDKDTVVNKTGHATSAMAILSHFGLESIVDELLATDGIHDIGNLLSLESNVYDRFDNLELWFEATDEPNRYHVCVSDTDSERYLRLFGHLRADGDHLSTVFSSSHQDARLPTSQLLALHAACARVAHMSGAAEFFNELERDVEETTVLAFDGSSARLLNRLISPFAIIPGVA